MMKLCSESRGKVFYAQRQHSLALSLITSGMQLRQMMMMMMTTTMMIMMIVVVMKKAFAGCDHAWNAIAAVLLNHSNKSQFERETNYFLMEDSRLTFGY